MQDKGNKMNTQMPTDTQVSQETNVEQVQSEIQPSNTKTNKSNEVIIDMMRMFDLVKQMNAENVQRGGRSEDNDNPKPETQQDFPRGYEEISNEELDKEETSQ